MRSVTAGAGAGLGTVRDNPVPCPVQGELERTVVGADEGATEGREVGLREGF